MAALVHHGRARHRTKPLITVCGTGPCQVVVPLSASRWHSYSRRKPSRCWEERIADRRQCWRDTRQRGTGGVIDCAPGEDRWFFSILHVIAQPAGAIIDPGFAITRYGRDQRAIFEDVGSEIGTCARRGDSPRQSAFHRGGSSIGVLFPLSVHTVGDPEIPVTSRV